LRERRGSIHGGQGDDERVRFVEEQNLAIAVA
jgi:hypothetical protein